MAKISAFQQQAERYDAWFRNNPLAYDAEPRAVRALLPAGGRRVEIGVGTGRFASPLVKDAWLPCHFLAQGFYRP